MEYAVQTDMWDMQILCLRDGCDADCANYSSSAWEMLLRRIIALVRQWSMPNEIPWDKVVRSAAAFLENGADPLQATSGVQPKAVLELLLDVTRGHVKTRDVELIKFYLKKPRSAKPKAKGREQVKTASSIVTAGGEQTDGTNDASVQNNTVVASGALQSPALVVLDSSPTTKPDATHRKRYRLFKWR